MLVQYQVCDVLGSVDLARCKGWDSTGLYRNVEQDIAGSMRIAESPRIIHVGEALVKHELGAAIFVVDANGFAVVSLSTSQRCAQPILEVSWLVVSGLGILVRSHVCGELDRVHVVKSVQWRILGWAVHDHDDCRLVEHVLSLVTIGGRSWKECVADEIA